MARFSDSFNRSDTAIGGGLGAIPNGGPAWQSVRGTWSIYQNRAWSGNAATSNPIAVVAHGSGNGDISITVDPRGGDSLYARVSSDGNWIRARVRQFQTSSTEQYYITEYEWACQTQTGTQQVFSHYEYRQVGTTPLEYEYRQDYGGMVGGDGTHHGSGYYNHGGVPSLWTWSTNSNLYEISYENYVGSHSHAGVVGTYTTSHYVPNTGPAYKTGNTRGGQPIYDNVAVYTTQPTYSTSYQWSQSNVSAPCSGASSSWLTGTTRQAGPYNNTRYFDNYRAVLEKCVGGVVSALGTATISAPSSLRLRAVGDSLQVFVNGSGTAAISVNDGTFKTVNRFGIGKGGPTETEGSNLDNFEFDSLNSAPNAAEQTAPSPTQVVDRTRPFRLVWRFSDPDVGDTQSRAIVYVKPAADTTWYPYEVNSPNTFIEFAAAQLAAGEWDWQVETWDSAGTKGPRTGTAKFTLGTPPAGPTITSPVNGGFATGSQTPIHWETADQTAFEIRRVSDNETTQYQTSGVIESASTRTHTLSFPTQNRWERVEIRTRGANGLWSSWTQIRLYVQYTPPPEPVTVVAPDASNSRIIISSLHQAGDTAVVTQRYERREVGTPFWTEVYGSAELTPGGSWSDLFVVPGQRYEYRTIAVGSNGTEAPGRPAPPVAVDTPKFWLRDPDTGDGRIVHVSDFPEIDRPRESTVFEPLDAHYPTVAYGPVRSGRGTFTIKVSDELERQWLMNMLESKHKLVLIQPAERPGGRGEVMWFATLRSPIRRLYAGKNPARLVPIEFVEVAPR